MSDMSQHVIEEILQVEKKASSIVDTARRDADQKVKDLQISLQREMQEYTILLRKQREQDLESRVC